MKNTISSLLSILVLTGCYATQGDLKEPEQPENWTHQTNSEYVISETKALEKWWLHFDDNILNQLVEISLERNPDRRIAMARINEARGARRTSRSALFPQIDIVAQRGREDTGDVAGNFVGGLDDFYDARFDASFELDIFGQNKKRVDAADAQIIAFEQEYVDTTLTLIAEVARTYNEYRQFQKQVVIANKNLDIQSKTLQLIKDQQRVGESPQLDVERAENLVNTTKASIPEFERAAENAKLRLIVLTGELPTNLSTILQEPADILAIEIKPILLAPADTIAIRPDIRAAAASLASTTAIAEAETASIFPTFNIAGFYGIADNIIIRSGSIWRIFVGGAVSLLDFGRIEGQIDTARAQEVAAYEIYRRTVLEAVTEVETALNDYSKINRQRISLDKAYQNAEKALHFSQQLFTEGEISFIDVLDSQRVVNEADSALITAEASQSESLIRLYKSMGVY